MVLAIVRVFFAKSLSQGTIAASAKKFGVWAWTADCTAIGTNKARPMR
jgi:hypothetical protein